MINNCPHCNEELLRYMAAEDICCMNCGVILEETDNQLNKGEING